MVRLVVFSDKDEKLEVPSHRILTKIWFLRDVKELTLLCEKSYTPVVWPTFPGLVGLSVRRDFIVQL